MALCIACTAPAAPALGGPQQNSQEASAPQLAQLRDLSAAGLHDQMVEGGLPHVKPGGPLANEGEAVALVARSLSKLGRIEESMALLDGARVGGATRGWVLVERARMLLADDDYSGVVRLLEEPGSDPAQPRTSEPVDAWIVLARAHARAGRSDRARPLAQGLLERDPLHPEGPSAWHLVERAHIAAGDLERARFAQAERDRLSRWHATVRAHSNALRADPEAIEPRLGMALAWIEVERFGQARSELEILAKKAPADCHVWFHLGEARRLIGELREAVEAYDRGVQCNDDDEDSRFQRAELRYRMGEHESAEADFEHLLATAVFDQSRFRTMHLRLAWLAKKHGDNIAANLHGKKYRELGGTEKVP